jgi:hypothetical protein
VFRERIKKIKSIKIAKRQSVNWSVKDLSISQMLSLNNLPSDLTEAPSLFNATKRAFGEQGTCDTKFSRAAPEVEHSSARGLHEERRCFSDHSERRPMDAGEGTNPVRKNLIKPSIILGQNTFNEI